MAQIYNDGTYLDNNPTWHEEDSPWKAKQIKTIIENNALNPNRICEVGCGAGEILNRLSEHYSGIEFYDVTNAAVEGDAAIQVYDRMKAEAESHGHTVFAELTDAHRERQAQQRQKTRRAFDARRKAIDRIGLPQVQSHRRRELEREEAECEQRLNKQDAALPELTALILLRIDRSGEPE